MGLLSEAFTICSKGVQMHPDFAGGRVAFAKILIDRKEREKANAQLERAVQISPDNLLAQSLLGENLLELRRPKDALKAFKMVLYLNPQDERALKAVQKWEFLSADEYDEELFKMQPVFDAGQASTKSHAKSGTAEAPLLEPEADSSDVDSGPSFELRLDPLWKTREVERAISLADAFTVRNDLDRAVAILRDAARELGSVKEIDRRLSLLSKRSGQGSSTPSVDPRFLARELKRAKLESLLQRISERRAGG